MLDLSLFTSNEPPPPIETNGTSEDYPPLPASLPKPANLPSRRPTATQMDNQTRTSQDSLVSVGQQRGSTGTGGGGGGGGGDKRVGHHSEARMIENIFILF